MRSQSQLTRNVYRRLLAGHGLLRPCSDPPGRRFYSQHRPRQQQIPLLVRPPHRRAFFGALFQKPPRQLKEPELDPGYDVLLKFRGMETENARPPPRDELVRGLTHFVRYKRRSNKSMNPTQAFLTTRLLRHLLDSAPEGDGLVDDIGLPLLRDTFYVVRKAPRGKTEDHLELSKLLYNEIEWRKQAVPEGTEDAGKKPDNDLKQFVHALTKYGASLEALERFTVYRESLPSASRPDEFTEQLWLLVLRGLAKEGREAELLQECQKATDAGVGYSPMIHELMVNFFATQDRVHETKEWFGKAIDANQLPTPEAYLDAIGLSQRNDQQGWCQSIFEDLIRSNPDKPLWDVAFQWAVLVMDKGVEDIKQMMAVMARGGEGRNGHQPDATTIDCLIAAAIEKQDLYLAERFLSLGTELGIEPQAATYILQMDYRLDAGDFAGAHAIYQKLQNQEIKLRNSEDLPVLNKYLRLLCAVGKPDLERILDVTAQLELRRAALDPETVVALCMVFLRSDQQYDVIDTLSIHTVSLSLEERATVRKAFVEYCVDTKVSTARVWDAYSLLRQFFPETEQADRVRLMDAFFARRRPDMACHIFGHMRGHGNPAQRPTAEIYVRYLEGIGRHPDHGSLRTVHNMLKMDTTVEVGTRVRNALMLAYAAVEDPYTALEFWEQIAGSAEGPSYNSLAILFWACERLKVRDDTAKKVWRKMQRMELEVPPSVFWSYCGALAGQGELEEVKRLIEGMESSMGYPPSVMT